MFPPLSINLSQIPPPNQERRSMSAHLSSVSSPPIPYYSPPPSYNLLHCTNKPLSSKSRRPSFSKLITSKKTQENVDVIIDRRKIGDTEPPWLVPAPPYNPSHGDHEGLVFDHHDAYFSTVPISLRLLQMRKKNEKLAMSDAPVELGSVGKAVWSLNCLIEELQLPALPAQQRVRVLRDGRSSMVWLFQKVFSVSPNLAVGFLDLTANFMVSSMEGMMRQIGVGFLEPDYGCWSDIGILDESEKTKTKKKISDDDNNYTRKKRAYEEMIIREKHNSMIFSNYAQLLYQYEKDYNRAKQYFELSVTVEPADAEVMSRYAHFLWNELGEMQTAEQMFLEAIAMDPENDYHRSNYALFLWKTGATDTCYPLNEPVIPKDDEEDELETEVYDKDEVKAERWSDIGILNEPGKKQLSGKDQYSLYIRKKMVYERMIINGNTNSLILSNYAQLLYQYEHDLDRANYYFNLSVTTEPFDAEAMSRYAIFLWQGQGDVEMAEEMFLKATATDPENNYHQRNYAWFLWNTGATDTCYPPDDCTSDVDEGDHK